MKLEQKVEDTFLNRIKKSLVGKIAVYSLFGALTFGGVSGLIGCGDDKHYKTATKKTFYEDADGDSYGNPLITIQSYYHYNPGYVAIGLDCNDNNPNIHPEASEILDDIDNNCDGQIDEGYLVGKIAFHSFRDGNYEVYVMNADGSAQTNLTNNPESDWNPMWSPNGSKIAFHSFRDGNYEVYVMNADGSAQTNLTNNPESDTYPVWSPNGSKIAFHSFRDGNYEVYVMNADGSAQTNLTNNPESDTYPVLSPDGSKIAFRSFRDGNYEVYVMNADGSAQTNLTNNPESDWNPMWSPNGSKIAFHSFRDGNYEVYVMNADGSAQTNLTNNP